MAGLHLHRLLVPRDRTQGAPVELVAALLDKGASVDEREPGSGAPLLHKASGLRLPCEKCCCDAYIWMVARTTSCKWQFSPIAVQHKRLC